MVTNVATNILAIIDVLCARSREISSVAPLTNEIVDTGRGTL